MLKWDKKKNWETGQKVSAVGRSCPPFSIHLLFSPSLAPFLLFSCSPSTLVFVCIYSVCLLGWMWVSRWGNRGSRLWARSRGAEGGGHPFSKPWLAIVLKQSVNTRGKACQPGFWGTAKSNTEMDKVERERAAVPLRCLFSRAPSALCCLFSVIPSISYISLCSPLIQLLSFGRVSAVF